MAWLDSVPEKQFGGKTEKRKDLLNENSWELKVEYEGGMQYILDYLGEIGYFEIGAFGIIGVTWDTLNSWKKLTHTPINARESIMLFVLSSIYVDQYRISADNACLPPITKEVEIDRENISNKIKTILSGYKRKK